MDDAYKPAPQESVKEPTPLDAITDQRKSRGQAENTREKKWCCLRTVPVSPLPKGVSTPDLTSSKPVQSDSPEHRGIQSKEAGEEGEDEDENERCHSLEALNLDDDMDDSIYYNLRRSTPPLIRKDQFKPVRDDSECIYADVKVVSSPSKSQLPSPSLHQPGPPPPPCAFLQPVPPPPPALPNPLPSLLLPVTLSSSFPRLPVPFPNPLPSLLPCTSPVHSPCPPPQPVPYAPPKPRYQRQPPVSNFIQPGFDAQAQALDDMREMEDIGPLPVSPHRGPSQF
ncbi:docking protein 3-like protein [Lates japonicus]|uniref:Docking protein 3-like protein n=1 Tax=Lates japonicus TaxID=270547 RepID=A0AAD3MYA2_LATJO|nr:docking protein 3-like protein [Lates japonicus]